MRKICVISAFLAVLLAFITCKNTTDNGTPSTIAVTGVTLKSSTSILVEHTETLYAVVKPENATNKNVTWSSTSPSVATVSSGGIVTGVNDGTATIIVATKDGGHQAMCTVTVKPKDIPVTGVTLKSSTSILVGHTETLYAIIEPENATNKNVTWSSTNTAVATVSSGGVVTGVNDGTAIIIVTTKDGGYLDTCTVTVSPQAIAVTGVSLNKTSAALIVGGTEDLTATITPSTATNQNITWNSGNTTVAEVSAAGVVTAKNVGSTTITVTTDDGNKTASCNVTVNPKVITFTVDAIPAQTYTGSAISPTVTVKDGSTVLTLNNDYTVAYTNNTNAGTATVTVSGKGNYAGSSGSKTFIITKVITFTVDAIPAQTYTGSAITPAVTVRDGSTALTINTDYTVAYTNNTNAGTATVTVSGKGNYAGSSGSRTFTINPKVITFTIDAIPVQKYTGTPITPSIGVKDGSTTLKLTTDYTVAYTNNINVGTATVTVSGAGNYAGSSYSITFIIDLVITEWAKTDSTGDDYDQSYFNSVAVDGSGNVYAAGSLRSSGIHTYGPGVTAQGSQKFYTAVLVKYNSSGTAQWAKTNSSGIGDSKFYSVAVDASGNVYAAGTQYKPNTTGMVGVLVKYNSGGTEQWTKIVGPDQGYELSIYSVAVDGSGNVYAAVSMLGGFGSRLVKYNSSGTEQWTKTLSSGSGAEFYSVAVDSSGNVYAAGSQKGTSVYTYGPGVTAQGTNSSSHEYKVGMAYLSASNIVLVKYNSSGTAQWAKTLSSGSGDSVFNSVAVDSSGNVYAAGIQCGTGTFTYGPGVTAQGTNNNANIYSPPGNIVLVKYNSGGTAQWAKTVSSGNNESYFNSVVVDSSNNVYAVGWQYGAGSFTYGSGVTAQGSGSNGNVVLVKYNSGGTAQWAKTVSSGNFESTYFNSVAVDGSGNVYAAGSQGDGTYTYGPGVTVQSSYSYGNHYLLVKYRN